MSDFTGVKFTCSDIDQVIRVSKAWGGIIRPEYYKEYEADLFNLIEIMEKMRKANTELREAANTFHSNLLETEQSYLELKNKIDGRE